MTRRLEIESYVAALRRDGAALADVAEGDLARQVPSCPEWSMADLVWHTGEVHFFWNEIAGRALQDPNEVEKEKPVRPPDEELIAWYRPSVERLAATLESTDPATPTWSWAPQRNVAFVQRRMAQETAVHRADAELAAGELVPIETALAADGVDEFFEFFLSDGECTEPGESIRLVATDVDASWLVTVTGGGFTVDPKSATDANGLGAARGLTADADATVRAPASDLLLALWRRRDPAELDASGDPSALERLLARADLE